jgi:CBS-domain-containing membrane protein
MRVNKVMTKVVVSTSPQSTVADALDLMARSHVSGLPVVDKSHMLVGIVSDADFLRRPEIMTLGRENRWYENFFLPARSAEIYAHTRTDVESRKS